MKKFAAVTLATVVSLGMLDNSPGYAQSMDSLHNRCMQADQAACNAWRERLHGAMNAFLDPVDPPDLRELRYRCQAGDTRACDEEIAQRQGIIRNYEGAINNMNRMHDRSWIDSFGLGGR